MPEESPSRDRVRLLAVAGLAFVLAAGAAAAQEAPVAVAVPGSVSGRVLTPAGEPARDAHVEIVELGRRVEVDDAGRFRFEGVPPGAYILRADSPRAGLNVARVEVVAAQDVVVEVTLDRALHQEVVVVTATPAAATLSEIAQPVSVLSGQELSLRMQPTLGETLAQEPGVASTYFGPGASRPVIRGLGGDRIRVLQSGVGTADASSTSPDHAVSFDPLSAEQVEVVRGPATRFSTGATRWAASSTSSTTACPIRRRIGPCTARSICPVRPRRRSVREPSRSPGVAATSPGTGIS